MLAMVSPLDAIDRGVSHECPGCGLYFCSDHLLYGDSDRPKCSQCINNLEPFTPSPDILEWIGWKLTEPSWKTWREQNPIEVEKLRQRLL